MILKAIISSISAVVALATNRVSYSVNTTAATMMKASDLSYIGYASYESPWESLLQVPVSASSNSRQFSLNDGGFVLHSGGSDVQ